MKMRRARFIESYGYLLAETDKNQVYLLFPYGSGENETEELWLIGKDHNPVLCASPVCSMDFDNSILGLADWQKENASKDMLTLQKKRELAEKGQLYVLCLETSDRQTINLNIDSDTQKEIFCWREDNTATVIDIDILDDKVATICNKLFVKANGKYIRFDSIISIQLKERKDKNE